MSNPFTEKLGETTTTQSETSSLHNFSFRRFSLFPRKSRNNNIDENTSSNNNNNDTIDLEKPFLKEADQETPLRLDVDYTNGGELNSSGSYDAFEHENENEFPDGGFRAWKVAVGSCFGLMSVFGIMDSMGSIQLYLTKHQLADVKLSSVSWIFSLYMFTNLAMGVIAGPMFDIYGVKLITLIGMVLNCGGLYATAFCTELWQFVLSFGICSGIGGGLMFTPLIGVVNHWFLRNRGKANGLSGCGAISGVFFPIMLRSLYPDIGYMKTMVTLASICVIFCLIAFLLVEDRCDVLNAEHLHIKKSTRLLDAYKHMVNIKNFKEKAYSFLVSGMFFNEFSIIIVLTYLATYASTRGYSESTGYVIITVMNASGILGKIIPTLLSDKLGRFNVMIMVCIIMVISLFAIWLPYYNIVGLYMFAGFYGFCFGSVFALTPVLIAQISHTKEFGSRFATAYFIVAFGNLIAMPIGSQFINKETVHNYNNMIIFTACTCAFALCLIIASRVSIAGWKLKCYV